MLWALPASVLPQTGFPLQELPASAYRLAQEQRFLSVLKQGISPQQERQLQQWKNDALQDELNEERSRNDKQHMQISELQRRCKRAEKLLNKLPDEVIQKLKQELRERER